MDREKHYRRAATQLVACIECSWGALLDLIHFHALRYAHWRFAKKTEHAVEVYGPGSIFKALTDCHANRAGHGSWLFSHEKASELAVEALDISRYHFRNMVLAGFKGSFFPGSYREKRAYVRNVINHYERLEQQLLPA